MRIPRSSITGLVLAGGRGSRMGGVDKGLQLWQGLPLVEHVLGRLAPQVGPVTVNANRNPKAYSALGVPVWPDSLPNHPGPLAGFMAGLALCETPFLVTAPCDAPRLPLDLWTAAHRCASAVFDDAAAFFNANTLDDLHGPPP